MIIKDQELVKEFFKYVYVTGNCCEVRIFNSEVDKFTKTIVKSRRNTTVAGWFDRPDELCAELFRVQGCSAYITVNPVDLKRRPDHARNNLKILKKGDFCLDGDISKIRYIIIDIDPIRPPGNDRVNSSQEELNECIDVRDLIISSEMIGEESFYGVSGNGTYILIKHTAENDEETSKDIFKFIKYISEKYSNNYCSIDINVRTPAKLIGIPGTIKYKGIVETKDRPYRMVNVQPIDSSLTADSQTRDSSCSSNGKSLT